MMLWMFGTISRRLSFILSMEILIIYWRKCNLKITKSMTEKYNKSSIELEIKLFKKFTKLSIKKVTASLLSGKNSSRKRKNTKAA